MTVDPNAPHDSLARELLGTPGDAAAVLQTVLPAEISRTVDWGSLVRDDSELPGKGEANTRTDLLFRAVARVGEASCEIEILVVIEHQSTDDWTMPLRMLATKTRIWRRSLAHRGQEKYVSSWPSGPTRIPLILPVVISHSAGGWRTSRRLDDMFAIKPEAAGLARYTPSFELLLIDVTATERDQLRAWAESLVARGAVAQGTMLIWFAAFGEGGEGLEQAERALREGARWIDALAAHDPEHAELLLGYLQLVTQLTGSVLAAMLLAHGAPKAASTMSTLHEMWEAQVREQWEAQQRERVFAEGKREGESEGKRKTLVKQLTLKFGSISKPDLQRIEQADAAVLETYLERVLTADSMAAVLGPE
jgi:hypothetical protein